ncbi:MAG TPA: Gfo/Idh/MocA family oxidoreductase [Roseiflexaceae bacterium]|nr:Gfo/Idh/MocA family oxidoreductase [Roseiflexaceae bacterium]
MTRLRIAQYGTRHGHAAGKLAALRANPRVELAGVFEPDAERRRELERAGWPWAGVHWFESAHELLGDPSIAAVASEGRNDESLDQTEAIVRAGKHAWYDKPAGTNWPQWQRVVALAEQRGLIIQMGYMFRYHDGFRRIAHWARSGLLGQVYAVRAHMSTWISLPERQVIARHRGGIFYDLAGHMIDQIVWLLGRPLRITSFLRTDDGRVPGFADNTLAVLEYPHALALVDIAAMEAPPPARRFEVYGERGSAIMEPFEPAGSIRLCLREAAGGYAPGEQRVPLQDRPRQALYELELDAFLAAISGERPPERPPAHELLVQEVLLHATEAGGGLEGQGPSRKP